MMSAGHTMTESFQIAIGEERLKGRLWACASYWSIILMIIGYVVRGKNRLFRYHLGQAVALVIVINITALFVVSFLEVIQSHAVSRGLALSYLLAVLMFRLDGTSNAWHGKFRPLPGFGDSLGQLVLGFILRAELVTLKVWNKVRAIGDDMI